MVSLIFLNTLQLIILVEPKSVSLIIFLFGVQNCKIADVQVEHFEKSNNLGDLVKLGDQI